MPVTNDLRFNPIRNYTAKLSDLVNMLNYSRSTTIEAIDGLDTRQLDFFYGQNGNSIASLLAHIASVEAIYYVRTFENRLPSMEEKSTWRSALSLGEVARTQYFGQPIKFYTDILDEIRQHTLTSLAQQNDDWLEHEFELSDGTLVNNHWAWFHVIEDEISHKGQILLIRNHLLV